MRLRWAGEPEAPFQPFADGGFGTPSGKGELFSAALAEQGLDPLPSFKPPKESRHTADRAYPLEFLPRKADNYMNSTFANLAPHQKMESAHTGRLEIHPDDAAHARHTAKAMRSKSSTIAAASAWSRRSTPASPRASSHRASTGTSSHPTAAT